MCKHEHSLAHVLGSQLASSRPRSIDWEGCKHSVSLLVSLQLADPDANKHCWCAGGHAAEAEGAPLGRSPGDGGKPKKKAPKPKKHGRWVGEPMEHRKSDGRAMYIASEGCAMHIASVGRAMHIVSEGCAMHIASKGCAMHMASEGCAMRIASEGCAMHMARRCIRRLASARRFCGKRASMPEIGRFN